MNAAMSDKMPEPKLLRRVLPDHYWYGDVYGYTADQLRAALAEQAEAHAAERDALRAEVEALTADAERYRWLRGGPDVPPESNRWARWEVRHWCGRWWNTLFAEALDAAIDAAMKGTT